MATLPRFSYVPHTSAASSPWWRRGRKVLVGIAVVVVALAALVWFAPALAARSALRDSVLRTATAKVNGTVTVGGVSLGWLRPVELTDVRVVDPEGREVLSAPVVRVSKTLLDLARDRFDFGTVTVERPTLTVDCGDRTNLEDVLAKLLKSDDAGGPRPAVRVEVTDARVLLAERGGPPVLVLDHAAAMVVVPREADGPIRVTASGKTPDGASPGTVEATADLGADLAATAKTDRFPLGPLGPLVRRFVPKTELGGTLTSDVAVNSGVALAVSGRAEVDGLDLAAPWLGPDRLRLARATLPGSVTVAGDAVTVGEGTVLDCDVGKLAVSGTFSPSDTPDKLLSRHGLNATADVDVAKLAALVPRLLRVRAGTELTAGHVHAELASVAGPRGTGWKGQVNATALHGTNAGRAIAWEQPLVAAFDAHLRPDGLPEFDDLQCQSDFIGLHARGTVSKFIAVANLDLDRLFAHLNEFLDLGGFALAGTGTLEIKLNPGVDGGPSGLNASVSLARFVFRDGTGHVLEEPDLTASLYATGKFVPVGPLPIDMANITVTADRGADKLVVTVYEPVADVRTVHTGKARVALTGDMGRWRSRVGPFAGLPRDWLVAGKGQIEGQIHLAADAVRCPKLTANVAGLRFHGLGLTVDEQQPVTLEAGVAFDRKTNAVELTDVRLASETAGVSSRSVAVAPLPGGGWGVGGAVAVTADVARVRRVVGLSTEVSGKASGEARLDVRAGGVVAFDGRVTGDNLVLGPPRSPTWTEPRATVVAAGAWDPAADGVRFDRAHVEADGLVADASGSVTKMTSPAAAVDVAGTVSYDLAKLEPQLRSVLGDGAHAVGKETRPFKVSGPINGVGGPAGLLGDLSGSATVGWQSVQAYGFDVGPGDLTATLDHGVVRGTPVKATFGGGTVEATPTVRLDPGYELSLAPGRIVTNAKLTPAVCASAVGFVLPPLAHAAEVEGLVSLDLAANTVPLADVGRANASGTLTVHKATVTAGPLLTQIATTLGAKNTAFTLTKEQAVPFRVENGRVYHENFTMTVDQTEFRTSGSVGLDGTVALFVDVQVPPRLADQTFANNPILKEALSKKTLRFPVGGTLAQPKLDPRGFQDAVQQISRDAPKQATGSLLKKGQDKLLQELEKKFGKPPGVN